MYFTKNYFSRKHYIYTQIIASTYSATVSRLHRALSRHKHNIHGAITEMSMQIRGTFFLHGRNAYIHTDLWEEPRVVGLAPTMIAAIECI